MKEMSTAKQKLKQNEEATLLIVAMDTLTLFETTICYFVFLGSVWLGSA